MTGLALWLALVAVLDVIRGARDASRFRLVLPLTGAGVVLAMLLAVLLSPGGGGWVAWVAATVGLVGWLLGSAIAAARFHGGWVPALARQVERLLILGLGIGGSLLGAAIVVAAKALLRFPELRVPRAGDPGYGGASDVTEYFLVGSFASSPQ